MKEWGEEMDGGGQKVESFSYKTKKHYRCNLQVINILNTAVCYT